MGDDAEIRFVQFSDAEILRYDNDKRSMRALNIGTDKGALRPDGRWFDWKVIALIGVSQAIQ